MKISIIDTSEIKVLEKFSGLSYLELLLIQMNMRKNIYFDDG
jgi:hypothetical protein